MLTYPFQNTAQSNLWSQVRQFATRGGFQSGLIPSLVGKVWYVNGNTSANRALLRGPVGSDQNSGLSPLTPLLTMAEAFSRINCYDVIVVDGIISEQVTAPLGVFDVTIIGAANRPRQATNGGVFTGGGAYWKAPASPTAATALLTLREQGWAIYNICFQPHTSSPCIEAKRAESATYPDPSHLIIDGCRFVDGTTGIGYQDSGGVFNVLIQNCIFQSLTHGIKGVAGAGIADPLMNVYQDNFFTQNTNDIVIGCSYGIIQRNRHKNTTTKKVSLTAGGHETVVLNWFDDNAADIDPAHGYDGSATGTWGNYTLNQAALQIGQPA